MVTKLFIRPNSISYTIISPTHFFLFPNKLSLSKLTIVSLFSTASHSTTPQALPYGPSLFKGKIPFRYPHQPDQFYTQESRLGSKFLNGKNDENHDDDDDDVIDKERFTRVFYIAALRVPAKDCFALENRIRGHLLNWPRIRNIARVAGDEVDEEIASLLGDTNNGDTDGEGNIDALNRRIYGRADGDGEKLSPVLYRERLAKEFNSRGYVKFRNLAKISRPPKRKRKGGKEKEKMKERNGKKGRDELYVVEVVDEEDGEDWKGLLGDEFKGSRKWKGSTRLLLLDERYADRAVEDLPHAIKVANPNFFSSLEREKGQRIYSEENDIYNFIWTALDEGKSQAALQEAIKQDSTTIFELVKCKLTLFYDYWQMNEVLEVLLPEDTIVPSAFETIGHIAHLNLRDEHLPYKKLIARVVLDKNKPKIQTIVNKMDAIHNDYRTMQLEVLAGNHSLVTMVVENGLRFHVDLATVYWNSRLATERQRLLNGFTRNDVVCDVFAGVGPIALSAAKKVKRVYANDLNPYAVDYLERNSVLNKLERKIEVFNMDGRRFINAMFSSGKAPTITQVVMNLPNDAAEYLDAFRGILKGNPSDREFTLPMIHVYGFSKAQDPEFDFHERIRIALTEAAVDVEVRKVRLVAPGKWMLCASFRLPENVAHANAMLTE